MNQQEIYISAETNRDVDIYFMMTQIKIFKWAARLKAVLFLEHARS